MKLFTSRADLEAKIEGLDARVKELEADLVASDENLAKANAELAEARETIAGFESPESIAALRDELEAATAAASPEAVEELALSLVASAEAPETVREAISAKASSMLAASGHVAISEVPEEKSATSSDIERTFASMSAGPERSAYFQKHSDVLSVLK